MNLFTAKLKEFLSKTIELYPVGTQFDIVVEPTQTCPFTIRDIEDQVRSVYGNVNNYMTFSNGEGNYGAKVESPTDLRREGLMWVKPFLFNDNKLDKGQVPPEVLHWLGSYIMKHKTLIEYLRLRNN